MSNASGSSRAQRAWHHHRAAMLNPRALLNSRMILATWELPNADTRAALLFLKISWNKVRIPRLRPHRTNNLYDLRLQTDLLFNATPRDKPCRSEELPAKRDVDYP